MSASFPAQATISKMRFAGYGEDECDGSVSTDADFVELGLGKTMVAVHMHILLTIIENYNDDRRTGWCPADRAYLRETLCMALVRSVIDGKGIA